MTFPHPLKTVTQVEWDKLQQRLDRLERILVASDVATPPSFDEQQTSPETDNPSSHSPRPRGDIGEQQTRTVSDVYPEREWLPDKILKPLCRNCGQPRGEHQAVSAVNDEHWCPLPPGSGLDRWSKDKMFESP